MKQCTRFIVHEIVIIIVITLSIAVEVFRNQPHNVSYKHTFQPKKFGFSDIYRYQ